MYEILLCVYFRIYVRNPAIPMIRIIVSAILLSVCMGADNQTKGTSRICLSPECITTASNLLHSLDFKQKPCENFYSFVCENWIRDTHLVEEASTQFSRLNDNIILRVKDLLESKSAASEHEKETRKFYAACINTEVRDKTGLDVLLKDLKLFGGWPVIQKHWDASNFSWTGLLIRFFENGYPINTFFGISVEMDIKNTSESLIVASVGRSASKNPKTFYNIMKLEELEEFTPKIPWRHLLRKLFPRDTHFHKNQKIMIPVPKALKTVNAILEEFDTGEKRRVLANYMFYREVLFAVVHLDQDFFFLYEDHMNRAARIDVWQMCVKMTMQFFHMSLTTSYARRYFDAHAKKQLDMMFRDIRASLVDSIKETEWLDQETKKHALLKVEKLKSAIAYQDEMLHENTLNEYYKSIGMGEDHFSNVKIMYKFLQEKKFENLNERRIRFKWSNMNSVLTANAFYQPNQNSITIPIGLLQDTFFLSGRPNYINYGSLGSIIGHELTHAFDASGSLYDEVGNYRKWWTAESWTNFKARTRCYVDQYGEYYETKVKSYMNGTKTLSENIADNGGLKITYQAYLKLLDRIGNEPTLPGLPFTERQMFWIAFASVWCRKQSKHNIENTIEYGSHSLAKFRVNGAVSNMKEFSQDFECQTSSKMNPHKKCSLWKE